VRFSYQGCVGSHYTTQLRISNERKRPQAQNGSINR
jgi:hypothetical protein